MIEDDSTASQTYELYGPTEYSMAEIAQLVDKEIVKHRRHLNIPKRLMKPAAALLNRLLWWKTTSADEVEREFIDQVIDPKAKTFKDLGIEPGELSNFTFFYLVSYLFHITVIKNETGSLFISIIASISKLGILRFTPRDGAGEEGREEVFTCHWQSIGHYHFSREKPLSLLSWYLHMACFLILDAIFQKV